MKLSNQNIYTYATKLNEAFSDDSQKLPIKINFYLQKNKNSLIDLAIQLEQERVKIITTYGVMNEEDGSYSFSQDNLNIAQKELEDLFNLEQEVNIYTVNIENLPDDISLTTAQMEAMLFMIE